jgi:glycosyltransferase A (GT-A) superfamily protein (DUF2064 family)
MSDAVLMIAARLPIAGQTKTRLGESIGMGEAARVYEGFLQDLARNVVPTLLEAGIDVVWTYSPPESDLAPELRRLGIDTGGVSFLAQSGDTWAARQDNLMRWANDTGYTRSVLIASDSPQVLAGSILDAFDRLRRSDVVIGRVHDGGYYLIGMAGHRDVLLDVPMSTDSAASALVANVRTQGHSLEEVVATFDVDVRDDLDLLVGTLSPDGGVCPATWRVLRELGIV